MDFSKILDELNKSSLFDLYRLQVAIGQQLDDPKRIQEIKSRLKPGQEITYFDNVENRLIKAVVINLKRTRLLVENKHDKKRWDIPFYYVNLDNLKTDIHSALGGAGVDRNQLKVGDKVGFRDRQNNELYGEVVRLNQKTATVLVGHSSKWRVAYSFLFLVIDSEGTVNMKENLIEGEVIGKK